jgi:hypothetical protein
MKKQAIITSVPSLLLAIVLLGGCASQPKAPAADGKPAAFWPPYPDEPRVQYLASYDKSTDVQAAKSGLDQLIYGKEREQVLAVNKPYGIKMYKGRFYVCDLRTALVTILDLRKHQTLVIGKGDADKMITPSDITIAEDGTKYVADGGKQGIFVYDANDRYVTTFVAKDVKPVGVAVYQDELYVCDFTGQRVVVMNRKDGQITRTFGGPGMQKGKFIRPLGIAVDSQGFVYVVDVMKCELQKFDREGKVVTSFGTASANVGGLIRPKQVAVDREGTIYVVDAAFQNVQLFDQNGKLLTYFGSAGTHPGAMDMPAGICVSDDDMDLFQGFVHPAFQAQRLVIVTNQFGANKVAVYAFGHLRDGRTVADIKSSKGLVPAGTTDQKSKLVGVPTTLPSDVAADATGAPQR